MAYAYMFIQTNISTLYITLLWSVDAGFKDVSQY